MRRASAEEIVIAVMVGPDTVACGLEDVTLQDVEAEAQQDVEILCADGVERVRRKAVDEFLPDEQGL